MKKVLIVIHDMRIGGAQKSLLSFLKCISSSPKGYDISLMVLDPAGPFMKEIPDTVTLLPPPRPLRWLGSALSKELLLRHFSLRGLLGECKWLWNKKCGRFPKGLNLQQKLWHSWKKQLPALKTPYDVAISYIDGVPNYYVMEKVTAGKKVLWVHNDYHKLGYAPDFDRSFYEAADSVVTISERCRQALAEAFPELPHKLHILENITLASEVLQKAERPECPEFHQAEGLKLLSVGRLNVQKGFDMAIEAASLLKQRRVPFTWLVLGEGPEREALEAQIKTYRVEDCFHLLGSRENPYCYMKTCDILVQSSRMEGKSIVLDELRLLCKPAVVTNYSTVRDSVEPGKNGIIVDITAQAIAEGILKLRQEDIARMTAYMEGLPKGNEKELAQYCEIML